VIPNFIDTSVWRPDREPCHRSKLAPAGEKIVMHVSNFRAVKRVEDVVEVFARIRQEVPARLVLVGDGPDRPRALKRAADLGVQDHVRFLGKYASVEEILSCADLFLLPSETESFGLAALEAMACGAPVVSTRAGGLPEVVDHGSTGFLFDVGAVDEMAAAGVRLLTDEALHDSVSGAARAAAVERFSVESVVPLYEAFYRQVID
jgi:N-acetyl-alpha-D-glucosaminyl L-malate synthase BshA